MHVTRFNQATPYDATGHFNMTGLRLQGFEVSPNKTFWVGLSHFLPGGGAATSASNTEKVYVVLEGEMCVMTSQGEVVLQALDSCFIAANEARSLINRGNAPASMLVIVGYAPTMT